VAATPNFKACISGHRDCVVTEYDWYSSINKRVPSAVATPAKFASWNAWDAPMSPKDPITSIALQSTAVWCLTGHQSGLVKLMTNRLDKGACHARFNNHRSAVTGIGLSWDQRIAVSVSLDSSLAITDLDTGKCFQFRHSAESGSDTGLRSPFSELCTAQETGSTLVAATCTDGSVPLWTVRGQSIEPLHQIDAATLGCRASSVTWSRDGTSAIIGCMNGTVSKWDLRNMQSPSAGAGRSAIERSAGKPFKCPSLMASDNTIFSLLSLRDDYVAVASRDGVRVFRWSDVDPTTSSPSSYTTLFGSEGVGSMVADSAGRFMFACCNRGSSPQNLSCLGYDLSDVLELAPPMAGATPAAPAPMAVEISDVTSPVSAAAPDSLEDGLGQLLDREVDFSLDQFQFDDDDLFGDFGL